MCRPCRAVPRPTCAADTLGWASCFHQLSVNRGDTGRSSLLQLRVLRLGFLQDGDVGVGVFPEREEFLILDAGLRGITRGEICSAQLQLDYRPQHEILHHTSV